MRNHLNIKIVKPEPLLIKSKKTVSSSLIRKSFRKWETLGCKANNLLNRNWTIDKGLFKKGRQLGKKIGFPTC